MKTLTAAEFDKRFDEGEDIMDCLDLASARRPALQTKRVNVDFPMWMVEGLDRKAMHLGVTRQSLIKMWVSQCLEERV